MSENWNWKKFFINCILVFVGVVIGEIEMHIASIYTWPFWKDTIMLGVTTTIIVEIQYLKNLIAGMLRPNGPPPVEPILPPTRVNLDPPQPKQPPYRSNPR